MEHLLRVRLLGKLDHVAFWAETSAELKKILVLELIRCEKAVGNGHAAERHERLEPRITDEAFFHNCGKPRSPPHDQPRLTILFPRTNTSILLFWKQ